MGFGPLDWIVILLIVFVIFGAGKLPQAGDSLGRAIRNFRKSAGNEDAIDVSPRAALREEPNQYPQLPAPSQTPMRAPRADARADAEDAVMPQLGARRRPSSGSAAGGIEDANIGPELTPRRRS